MSQLEQKQEAFREQIKIWQAEAGVPGVVVGVSYGDEILSMSSGVTSVTNPLEVDDDTLFQIGSITKTYTVLAILRLLERGQLDLQATVQSYLPDFRVSDADVSRNVTIQNLITHTAGWEGDVFTNTGNNDNASAEYVRRMQSLKQLAPPDTVFSYNNSAFVLAGQVIETVTGLAYEAALQDLVLEPLSLSNSFFFPGDIMTHRFVVGHQVDDGNHASVLRPWAIPRAINSAGGISCSIKDLLTYARFHTGDGKPLVSPETLNLMHTAQFPISDAEGAMGLGWFIADVGGTKILQHGGGTIGQVSYLALAPERDFALGILTNATTGGQLIPKIRSLVYREILNLEQHASESYDADASVLDEYAGKYARPYFEIELRLEDGKLILDAKQNSSLTGDVPSPIAPSSVAMCGHDLMLGTDGPFKGARLEFIRDDDGEILYLRIAGRINPRIR